MDSYEIDEYNMAACVGCGMVDMTLKDGIEAYIKDEVDGVEAVVLDNPFTPFEVPEEENGLD